MSDAPKPDTTLSDEDAAKVEVFANPYARGLGWNRAEIVRIIRDLDARLALSLANERGAEYEIREVRAENAALTERLRVAEEHAAAIEDRINALKPFVVHENGAHKVLLHNFDVMVAFFGDKDQPHRWDDLTAALAPTSDAAPKEAT